MKDYKINNVISNGREAKQIRLYRKKKLVFNRTFQEEDKEKIIRQADLSIIKNNLRYNTKKLKPIL